MYSSALFSGPTSVSATHTDSIWLPRIHDAVDRRGHAGDPVVVEHATQADDTVLLELANVGFGYRIRRGAVQGVAFRINAMLSLMR